MWDYFVTSVIIIWHPNFGFSIYLGPPTQNHLIALITALNLLNKGFFQYLSKQHVLFTAASISQPRGCNCETWPIMIITPTPIHCKCLITNKTKITGNITIQEFNNYFAYTMNGILQSLCDFPSTSHYLILGISFVFHIISLKMV